MARIRSAKPDFWTDPLMCSLPRDIRFTFKGIWEACADDLGRFLADARVVKGSVWPLDDDITLRKIEKYLGILNDQKRIHLYVDHGVRYGVVRNWLKHQRVSHPSPSRYPEPPVDDLSPDSGNLRERFASTSVLSGAEGRGGERNRSGAEGLRDVVVREDMDDEPPAAPLLELPRSAKLLLDMFYEPALSESQRERYLDVKRQLYEALRPGVPGPKIRGGIRAKARNAQHLEEVCALVCKDPPNDRDMAIVFVLKKLTDPPKGPTVSEQASEAEKKRLALDERYQHALREAGVAWSKGHAEEYEAIRRQVDAGFPTAALATAFGKIARDTQLVQRCGREAGFPAFDIWVEQQRGAA